MGRLTRIDRRAGAAVREAVSALPGGTRAAGVAAGALSPAFRVLVAVLIARARSRRTGLEALAAGVGAATAARLLRDRLGRRRPGPRDDGGFPSRHAAAAAAIAAATGRRDRTLGRALAVAAAVGLTGRVASADHDPADIVAGVAVGLVTARALERLSDQRVR